MGNLAKAAAGTQLQAANPQRGLQDIIKSQWDKIEAVMPRHMSGERLYQLAVSAVNQTPKLAECAPETILSCIMKCSALGLEPSAVDGLGRAYILPYRNKDKRTGRYRMEATFILGYKGMIDIARRSGQIKDISARAVYEGDSFEFEFGLDEKLGHRPAAHAKRTPETLTHVYMVAHFTDGGHYIDVMTKEEVDAIRKRSKASESGPWVTDYEAMAKKTVVRRAFPYLPVSVEEKGAAAADETDGGFADRFNLRPVIDVDASTLQETGEAGRFDGLDGQETTTRSDASDAADLPAPNESIRAVCEFCGNVVDVVTPDATPDDLNASVGCCEHPHYRIGE